MRCSWRRWQNATRHGLADARKLDRVDQTLRLLAVLALIGDEQALAIQEGHRDSYCHVADRVQCRTGAAGQSTAPPCRRTRSDTRAPGAKPSATIFRKNSTDGEGVAKRSMGRSRGSRRRRKGPRGHCGGGETVAARGRGCRRPERKGVETQLVRALGRGSQRRNRHCERRGCSRRAYSRRRGRSDRRWALRSASPG